MEQVDQILIKTMCAAMSHHMTNLRDLLALKEDSIRALEDRVDILEATRREQHFRCPNRCFQGIPEAERECTNDLVIATVNEKMGLKPTVAQLERSHHLGPKKNVNGRTRKRATIVCFRSEAARYEVYRVRGVQGTSPTHAA